MSFIKNFFIKIGLIESSQIKPEITPEYFPIDEPPVKNTCIKQTKKIFVNILSIIFWVPALIVIISGLIITLPISLPLSYWLYKNYKG